MKIVKVEISNKDESYPHLLNYQSRTSIEAEVVKENGTSYRLRLPDGNIIRKRKDVCTIVSEAAITEALVEASQVQEDVPFKKRRGRPKKEK